MSSELVSRIDDDDYLPTPERFVWQEDKITEVRTKDWQERRYLGHGPFTESDDELRVIQFNVTISRGASADGSVEVRSGAVVATRSASRAQVRVPHADAVGRYQRRCWLSLTSAGLVWGGVSGAAFSLNKFPVAPAAALLGSLGIFVLSLTLYRLGRAD